MIIIANWTDVITLIKEITSGHDEDGFSLTTEEKNTIFANKKYVGYSEFWKASLAGVKTEIKFDIYACDYDSESLLEHEGKRYKILKQFPTKDGEFTELTVTDLSQG